MSWAIPVFRAFGIPVKVHLFFFIITLGLFFREVARPETSIHWVDAFLLIIVMVFGVVLLHELGHCFAGRYVGGEAREILIWPLGGLAFVDTPQNWRAHTITAIGGPAVNAVLCLLCAAVLGAGGFVANANPFVYPFAIDMTNYKDGRTYTSSYGARPAKATPAATDDKAATKPPEMREATPSDPNEKLVAPTWAVWVQRAFWVNLVQLLFNLLPCYPLDGGQILEGLVWWRSTRRQAMSVAGYSGFAVGVLALIVSLAINESFVVMLGLFILYSSWMKLQAMDAEEGLFGYDFSAGYTSLERDEPAAPRPKQPGAIQRWMQARAAKKLQREVEERQREEERFDQLLEKVHKSGKASLTDEERRFMERFSTRYRNRS